METGIADIPAQYAPLDPARHAALDAVIVEGGFHAQYVADHILPLDPEIVREADMTHAGNGQVRLTALDGARVFKRRAIKGVGSPNAREVAWLVVELNGVRVYVNGNQIVVSTQDLYP